MQKCSFYDEMHRRSLKSATRARISGLACHATNAPSRAHLASASIKSICAVSRAPTDASPETTSERTCGPPETDPPPVALPADEPPRRPSTLLWAPEVTADATVDALLSEECSATCCCNCSTLERRRCTWHYRGGSEAVGLRQNNNREGTYSTNQWQR